MANFVVAALYHFTPFEDHAALQGPLLEACKRAGTSGTLLLASEGINGTIAGSRDGIDAVLVHIRALPGCENLEHKESFAETDPFLRMKVRLKKEIVTMGVPGVDPLAIVGTYVEPEDWNALISDPGTVVIDTRNDYEVRIGTFDGAINPETKSFREFPDWFRAFREQNPEGKVAMFCTGGIRCEKSTAFVKSLGIEEVYHLKGGILKYLETVPEQDSLWRGECFVFDQRVSVGHGLALGSYDQCYACRMPLNAEELASPEYEPGVSCPHCVNEKSTEQKERFAARQRQVEIAKEMGIRHVGAREESGA